MQRLDVRLPPSTLAALRRIAALRGLSQAEVVQRLVLSEDQQVRERFAIAPERLARYEAGAEKRRGRTPRGKTMRKAAQSG
jgi:transcriptional regulator with XRE-family HTH domain